ncbi:HAD family hydrolase [Roseomonas sp. ROY-5-3]|uniref:HAD family hydrolase n=2 Tax=Acetobacterales TaxID=3120395 RepID=A0ABS6HF46_9PROT|nr:HAD family hydrolase [Roseomonas oleicola]
MRRLEASENSCGWASWLARFKAILLDMNGTFMFGHDRFLPRTNYWSTYVAIGGQVLTEEEVDTAICAFLSSYGTLYANPALADDFPTVLEALSEIFPSLPDAERHALEAVIAKHEMDKIPERHAAALQRLAQTHRLGVVSNIWSHSGPWRDAFGALGLERTFEVVVFSSDHRSVKPSRRPFEIALRALDLMPGDVLFVGDDLLRDVVPARSLGIATLWIGNPDAAADQRDVADRIVKDLCDVFD